MVSNKTWLGLTQVSKFPLSNSNRSSNNSPQLSIFELSSCWLQTFHSNDILWFATVYTGMLFYLSLWISWWPLIPVLNRSDPPEFFKISLPSWISHHSVNGASSASPWRIKKHIFWSVTLLSLNSSRLLLVIFLDLKAGVLLASVQLSWPGNSGSWNLHILNLLSFRNTALLVCETF